jgi:hypothetical protein
VEFVSNLYPEGEHKIIQCNIRDITERKKTEAELQQAHADLVVHAEDLARFNRLAVDRELRMIELKKQVNELQLKQNGTAPYPLDFEAPQTLSLARAGNETK